MTWRESFAPLQVPSFAWYFTSRFTNTLGSMMAGIALTFAVLDLTGAPSALGEVLAARTIAMVVFLLFGGVIADRFPRTLILQLSNLSSALTQGLVAWLVLSGSAQLWMIIVLEAVNGMVSAVSFPAMASMVPQLVPRAELQRANALLSLSRSGLTIIGPTVGALLVVTIGAGWALAADAASWLLASLLLLRVHLPARAPRDDAPPPNMLRELKEGWSVFIGYTWLWIVVVAFGVLNAIQAGAWFTIGPAVAEHTIGKQGWGFALSAESAGLVLTTLVMLRLSLRRPLYTGMIGCSLLAVPMFMLGFDPHVVPLVIAAFAGGVGIEVFSMGWSLAMQENIDEHLLSRAYSYDSLGSFVAMPIGQLVYGPLGTAFGFGNVLMVSGVVYAFVALVTLGSRSVRSLERAPVKPSPGGAAP